MKEILFRGKQIDNGEWVEGYYVKALDMYDKEIHVIFDTTATFYSFGETSGFELVDPETICQCTGLTDKCGNKIWEGDIMREIYCPHHPYEVIWDDEQGGWALGIDHEPLYYIGSESGEKHEVIGNVYDNPELLEV